MGSALAGKRARGGAVFVVSSGAARCRSRCVALLRERDAREGKGEEEMKLGFLHRGRPDGFVRPRCALGRRMRTDGRDLAGCIAAQAGARGRGALPA